MYQDDSIRRLFYDGRNKYLMKNLYVRRKNMKLRISLMSAFLLLLLAVRCKSPLAPENTVDIALYAGDGASEISTQAANNMFQWMGYTVSLVEGEDFDKGLDHFRLLCFPGGDMYQYGQSISSDGKENIRDFIRSGGGYIGICGGAYFASEHVVWQGTALPMMPLGLLPGTAQGPIDAIAPYPNCTMCRVIIVDLIHPITQSSQDSEWILYCYGPTFTPSIHVDILARYEIGNQPAMLAFDYGRGRVFLIGLHPEIEEDSDRDGVTFGDSFDDQGSDWELMRRAMLWCLRD
jgi:glutamine amidotransferase-like uncharacterized protein